MDAALLASANAAMRRQSQHYVLDLAPTSVQRAAQPSPPLSGELPVGATLSGALPGSVQDLGCTAILAAIEDQIDSLADGGPLRGAYQLLGREHRRYGSAILLLVGFVLRRGARHCCIVACAVISVNTGCDPPN